MSEQRVRGVVGGVLEPTPEGQRHRRGQPRSRRFVPRRSASGWKRIVPTWASPFQSEGGDVDTSDNRPWNEVPIAGHTEGRPL